MPKKIEKKRLPETQITIETATCLIKGLDNSERDELLKRMSAQRNPSAEEKIILAAGRIVQAGLKTERKFSLQELLSSDYIPSIHCRHVEDEIYLENPFTMVAVDAEEAGENGVNFWRDEIAEPEFEVQDIQKVLEGLEIIEIIEILEVPEELEVQTDAVSIQKTTEKAKPCASRPNKTKHVVKKKPVKKAKVKKEETTEENLEAAKTQVVDLPPETVPVEPSPVGYKGHTPENGIKPGTVISTLESRQKYSGVHYPISDEPQKVEKYLPNKDVHFINPKATSTLKEDTLERAKERVAKVRAKKKAATLIPMNRDKYEIIPEPVPETKEVVATEQIAKPAAETKVATPKTAAKEIDKPTPKEEIVLPKVQAPITEAKSELPVVEELVIATAVEPVVELVEAIPIEDEIIETPEIFAVEPETLKVVRSSNSTKLIFGTESYAPGEIKLVRKLDGSIKLEIEAQRVTVNETSLPQTTKNEFTMTFEFEPKTEIEKLVEPKPYVAPWIDKVLVVFDGDNFSRYIRYKKITLMENIAKFYVNNREMLIKPQYFISCNTVPSDHALATPRDRHVHEVVSGKYFNVDWTRIKDNYEDESMFDADMSMAPKDRPRGYGDADVARFLLQQNNLERYETVLFFGHDHHYVSTVAYLKSIGKKVELYHTGWWWTSRELRKECDIEVDITSRFPADYPKEILHEIDKRKKQRKSK